MTATRHLALPLLAAAQAMKHVTHNEALVLLDALVHLGLAGEAEAPPEAPQDGLRLLVGPAPTGAFAGMAGRVALFDAGAWRFLAPRAGWSAYVAGRDDLLVHDGGAWRPVRAFVPDPVELPRLGIGTGADDLNRLAAKLGAALFTARGTQEGGTGDLRFVLNKEGPSRVLSQLYQSGYGGRAETGLIGDDDFRIRVSADGGTWRDALVVDAASGAARFPCGASGLPAGWRNLLVNPACLVNQRGFPGGALSAGAYGFDRWRGGPGGASLARAADGTLTLSGAIEQAIESPDLRGEGVVVSVGDPSGPIAVSVSGGGASATGTIAAGAGRRAVALQVPWEAWGHVTLRLACAAPTTFRAPQLEAGAAPSAFERRPLAVEEALCRRYFQAFGQAYEGRVLATTAGMGPPNSAALLAFPTPMRAAPVCALTAPGTFGHVLDETSTIQERVATEIEALETSPLFARLRVRTDTTSTTRARAGQLRLLAGGRVTLDAEL